MRIAFDLDDTLLPCAARFPLAPRPWAARLFGGERLRASAPELLRELSHAGHELWVYTTSFRSPLGVRALFLSHGVWLGGVVNQRDHDERMRSLGERWVKYPPAFNIDLLFDDSIAVVEGAQRGGFAVCHVQPTTRPGPIA